MTSINYCRYSTPSAHRLSTFLRAHKLSKDGSQLVKKVAELQAGHWQNGALFCGIMCLGVPPTMLFLHAVSRLKGILLDARDITGAVGLTSRALSRLLRDFPTTTARDFNWTVGGCATFATIGLFCRYKSNSMQREYELNETTAIPPKEIDRLTKLYAGYLRRLEREPGTFNFTPLQFENEAIYYEQVLRPHLIKIIDALKNADDSTIHSGIKRLAKEAATPPPFLELSNYDLDKLEKLLRPATHPDPEPREDTPELTSNMAAAIVQYLRDLKTVISETRESRIGELLLDPRVVNRLAQGTDLPGQRPTLRGEIERLTDQPDIEVPPSKARYLFPILSKDRLWPTGPQTYKVPHLLSVKGSALYGNAVGYQYWASHRQFYQLAAVDLALAISLCHWTKKYVITHPSALGAAGVFMVGLLSHGVVAALPTALLLMHYNQMRRIERESPWATKQKPQWLSDVGLWRAADYLKAQASLAATSLLDQGTNPLNHANIQWLSDNSEAWPDAWNMVKEKVKQSPFGYISLTDAEWRQLPLDQMIYQRRRTSSNLLLGDY